MEGSNFPILLLEIIVLQAVHSSASFLHHSTIFQSRFFIPLMWFQKTFSLSFFHSSSFWHIKWWKWPLRRFSTPSAILLPFHTKWDCFWPPIYQDSINVNRTLCAPAMLGTAFAAPWIFPKDLTGLCSNLFAQRDWYQAGSPFQLVKWYSSFFGDSITVLYLQRAK